jgi:hypothetical protein
LISVTTVDRAAVEFVEGGRTQRHGGAHPDRLEGARCRIGERHIIIYKQNEYRSAHDCTRKYRGTADPPVFHNMEERC